jgi:potassium channel subfamily K
MPFDCLELTRKQGFGDFSPKTHLGRSLLFPMAVGGILFLGLIISSIRSLVIQGSSNKISIRMVEKARESAIAKLDTEETSIALRPWQKHYIGKDVNTELGRREQEFNLMRQVQKKSATDYHIMILALSFGTACFLWFGGAAIFQAAELNSEGWTYFESLYFTYVALLTIGYGDFYAQTNSAKPAFVFWSLIALPTLTVFIGSIGDAISDGVGNVTLWLSHHLPEGTGALRDLKGAAHKKKKGDGGAHQQAKPAGFMSHPDGTDKSGDTEAHPDHHDPSKDVIKQGGKHYKQLLIMKQMKQTIQHLDATPPRKYTYSEWCWILKLLGQDESSEEHHRSPHEVKKAQNAGELNGQTFDHGQAHAGQPESDGTVVPWSWLGHKSPLMSGIDEPKWVLDRLMDALERELHEQAHDGMDDETKANLEELHKPRNSQSSKESTKEST